MLGTINLRRFAQNGGSAVLHQQVHRRAQRRVGADTRIAVRAAALQTDGDVFGTARLALCGIGAGQHLFDELNALFHRQARAACVLDVEDLERVAHAQAAVCQPGAQLVGLAAQAHHHHAPEVGVCGITGQRALEQLHAQTFGVHPTAGAVGQCHHPVHIWKVGQRGGVAALRKMVGNGACRRGRAVHARQHADVVACGHAAVCALVAHEAGLLAGRFGFDVLADGVVALEIAFFGTHVQVVRVHMLARRDGLVCKTNDLVVAAHRLAHGDGACSDFVARRNQAAHGDAVHGAATHELAAGNDHVVRRVQANE